MVEIGSISVIINGNSGKSRFKRNPERIARKVEKYAKRRCISADVKVTYDVEKANEIISASLERKDDAFFIFGGDGTFRSAFNKVLNERPNATPEDLPVFFSVPFGSLNILGKALGVPRTVWGLFRAVDKGRMRRHIIDIGIASIDGGPIERFASSLELGEISAKPFKLVDRTKNKRGGFSRHLKPIPKIIWDAKHLSGTISIDDGQTIDKISGNRSTDVVIQNAGRIGPFDLGPREDYNGREFMVMVSRGIPSNRFSSINATLTALTVLFDAIPGRQGKPSRFVEKRFRGKDIVIDNLSGENAVAMDGDYIKDAEKRVVVDIEKSRLPVAAQVKRGLRRRRVKGEGEKVVWRAQDKESVVLSG